MRRASLAVLVVLASGCGPVGEVPGPSGDVPADGGGALETGAPCSLAAECAGGLCIPEVRPSGVPTGWPGGACTRACPLGTCPEGEACAELSDGNWCVAACTAPGERGECRAGYVCNSELSGCLPDCREGWSCGTAWRCDEATGECRPANGYPAPVGAPCEDDAQCASGVCLEASEAGGPAGFTGGMCVAPCSPTGCPLGARCVVLPAGPLCLPGCQTAANCRPGYVCPDAEHVCLPDCTGGFDCGPDRSCDPSTGLCVAPTVPPKAAIGERCAMPDECASGFCLLPMGGRMGGGRGGDAGGTGFCSAPCGVEPCADGTTCVGQGQQRHCMPACDPGARGAVAGGCPPGTVCDPLPSACVPDCRQGWPCPGMNSCSPAGTCVPQRRPQA